jgi:DNA-binding response OmpR family regulator
MWARACILAVDDEPSARSFFDRTLAPYGHVVVARSLAEARRYLDSYRAWRAFVLDLRLGDGFGLDLLPEIRRLFPSEPALVLSGHVEGWVVNSADDLNADVLSKPLEPKRLHRWIERALGLSSTAVAQVPAALCEPIAALRCLLASRPLGVVARYEVGEIVAALKSQPERFGTRAVTVVATAIGQDEENLYRHARVAERWKRVEFEAMASRRTHDGRALSWSHFVLLASVGDAATGVELLERTLLERMPVSRLETLVQARARSGTEQAPGN